MTKRRHPKSGAPVTCRISEPELTRVEVAAAVAGLSRSKYMSVAVCEAAARDLARLTKRAPGRSGM